jgi:DNA-binding CsgD family transcriptional regulator
MNFVLKQLRLFNKSVQDSKSALQTAYTTLHSQQTLLKRRITAIHDMTTSCGDLAEWEKICVNIFQYELNIHPMIWLSQTAEKSLSKELPNLLFIKDNNAMTLLSEVGCLSWRQAGVAVLLPIVFGDAVQAVIGLSPEEPLSNEDMDFTVMVSKELQKSLQFIRAAETLKTLNMATFVEANESLFREFRITDRELEIIGLLVQGTSNAGISSALVISASTTKRHIYNIFQKLGIKSRFELLGWVGDRAVEG